MKEKKRILNIKFEKYKQEFKKKSKKYDNKKITEKDFVEWIKNQKALSQNYEKRNNDKLLHFFTYCICKKLQE